jgi:hypothetical protein
MRIFQRGNPRFFLEGEGSGNDSKEKKARAAESDIGDSGERCGMEKTGAMADGERFSLSTT